MNFSKMQERLLVRLYHLTLNGIEEGKFGLEFIENVTPDEIPRNLISKLLESLCEDKLLNRTSKSENWTKWTTAEFYDVAIRGLKYYGLTTRGLKYIDRILDEGVLEEWDLRDAYNEDYLLVQKIAEKDETVPASDRSVALDHNSASYADAMEKLDEASEAIRGFNGETDYNKEEVVGELTAAKVLFQSRKIRIGAVVAVVLTPLYSAYNDVGAEAIKPVISAAIDAIKLLFGL